MNGPYPDAARPRDIIADLTSLLSQPGVSSLIDGAVSGISSIANNPDVTSAVGSLASIVTSGGNKPSQPQTGASVGAPTANPTAGRAGANDPDAGTLQARPSGTRGTDSGRPANHTGAIVGGVIGGLVGLALLAALIFFCLRRRRHRKKQPPRDMDNLFEHERFDHTDGTPGLVDPYASTGPGAGLVRNATLLSSDSSHSPTTTNSYTNSYATPPSTIRTKAEMAGHAAPMTNSHSSIPATVTTGTTGTPLRRSVDTGFSDDGKYNVARSNTMTSTMSHAHGSRPLPAVPLSPVSPSSTWSHSGSNLHHSPQPPPVPPAPAGFGFSHPGPLTPYAEEPTVVEHAVDAGTVGPRKEVLPPMYDPSWHAHGR